MKEPQPLLHRRTDEAREIRKRYGDNSGMCRFSDKESYPGESGVCSCITSVQKDSLICEPIKSNMETKPKVFNTEDGRKVSYRIRRLTCRETYRLMDVDDCDIDKMLSTRVVNKKVKGVEKEVTEQLISDSNSYKLAGNSIVVGCLAGIYESIFNPCEEVKAGEQMELSFEW